MSAHDLSIAARTTQLWAAAHTAFARLRAAFGDASAIAALDPLTRALRRELLAWLAPLEALVRKLILIEAATFSGVAPLSTRKPPPRRAHSAPRAPECGAPGHWRAPFHMPIPPEVHRCVPEDRAPRIRLLGPPTLVREIWRAQGPSAPPASPRQRSTFDPEISSWRLARRVEALRRALDNPKPHARRLARRLARFGSYERRACVLRIACAPAPRGNLELLKPLRNAAVMGLHHRSPPRYGLKAARY
jgi:hypothetical protein